MTAPGAWAVEHRHGGAGVLHGLELPAPLVRTVWVCAVVRPAVVLGSSQRGVTPVAPPGVDVVTRRSGGGAVWLAPGGTLWVDVLVPRGDPLWDDDVGRASWWLGDVWAAALDTVGVSGASAYRGPMRSTPWSAALCFSGIGPGEVTLGPGGPKLVGISQRRTRAGARFQCVAYADWAAEPLASAVGVPAAAVEAAGAGVGEERLGPLQAAFLVALPST